MTPEERANGIVGPIDASNLYYLPLGLSDLIADAIRATEQEAEERGYKRGVLEERESISLIMENSYDTGITWAQKIRSWPRL